MARDRSRIGVEVNGLLVGPGGHAETAADVDLGDRVAVGQQPASDRHDASEGRLEVGQPVGKPA